MSASNVRTIAAIWLILVGGASCGGDSRNELAGSIREAGYTLDFDRVRISRSDQSLLIQYVDDVTLGNGQEVLNQPVRLTMGISETEPQADTPYVIPADVTVEHAVITLDSLGQPADEPDFPRVSDGELTLEQIGETVGQRVQGEFSCLFENNFTLNGRFSAKLSPP